MTDAFDDLDFADRIQDEAEKHEADCLPFEPCAELRKQTPHGEREDVPAVAIDAATAGEMRRFETDLSAFELTEDLSLDLDLDLGLEGDGGKR